jgi:uncharacterized protein (TIGR03437 family)
MCKTFIAVLLWLLPLSALKSQTIDDFFDRSQLQELRVTIDPAGWQTLRDNYLENTYYRCDVEWQGIRLTGCGLRSRGSGSRSPIKPGLTLDFSRFNSSQRLVGLKSVVLRNLSQDATAMRERISERLFARMGLPYSREAHAKLYINGEYFGLYLMVEPIDKRFLKTRFGDDSGYLFEMQPWTTYRFEYLGGDPGLYIPDLFEPKTHEDEPEGEKLVALIRDVNQATDAEFAAAASKHLDLKAFITHVAVEQFLDNWDSILADGGMTNFYFYRRMADNRWTLIVWDQDAAFSSVERPIFAGTEGNVLIRRALELPEVRRRYLEALRQASEIVEDWALAELEQTYHQIRTAAREDPNRVCSVDGVIGRCDAETFEAAVDYLRVVIRRRPGFVMAQVAALLIPPQGAPWLRQGDVQNPASGEAVLTPGSLATVKLRGAVDGSGRPLAYPLPEDIDGVSVWIGEQAAPILALTASEAVFQVPCKLACGPVPVVVKHHGVPSNTVMVEARPSCSGIFGITHATGILVSPSQPAKPGELLVIYATGLGPVSAMARTGWGAPYSPLLGFEEAVTVQAGNLPARILWSGLTPGLAGIHQVIAELPAGLPAGQHRLTVLMNGEPGTPFPLPVN